MKLCAGFHHHIWIQTGATVRKRLSGVMTSVTLTFDFWPWPLAWTSLLSMVITPENFMMIRWQKHSEKGVTDRQTDGQTDRRTERSVLRAAWSQLKKGVVWWLHQLMANKMLELTDTPTNLANQVKVGHALDQSRSVQSRGPERAHQNNGPSWRSSQTDRRLSRQFRDD